jgi:hypothetical protein
LKVAFVAHGSNLTPIPDFVQLCKSLEARGHSAFLAVDRRNSDVVLQKVASTGVRYYIGRAPGVSPGRRDPRPAAIGDAKNHQSTRKRLIAWAKKHTPRLVFNLLWELSMFFETPLKMIEAERDIGAVFDSENPDRLIVYGDRMPNTTAFAIRWMRRRARPVYEVQLAASDRRFLYTSARLGSSYSARHPLNIPFTWIYPRHVATFDGRRVVFTPWCQLLWWMLFDVVPLNPWEAGGSWAAKFLMIGESHRQSYSKDGADPEKSVVVGQLSLDLLHQSYLKREATRARIFERYFPNADAAGTRLVVLGMPQFFEHSLMSQPDAMTEIRYMLGALDGLTNVRTLMSLHPKMDPDKYRHLEATYESVRLADEALSEILPAGDLFVSAFKSTIPWAILCDVRPVFLDYWTLGFDLAEYPACEVFKVRAALASELQRALELGAFKVSKAEKDAIAPFDGQAAERICRIVTES